MKRNSKLKPQLLQLSVFVILTIISPTNLKAEPGNVDGQNGVDLRDAVIALQVLAGMNPADIDINGELEGDSNDQIGLEEAIFALRQLSIGGELKYIGDLGEPENYDATLLSFEDTFPDTAGSFDNFVAQLPDAFDWRDYNAVTRSKDQGYERIRASLDNRKRENQGYCGSCWAFAAVAALESKILIAGGPEYNLSEQQLVSCNTEHYGCCGGFIYAATYWENHGPKLENCTDYDDFYTRDSSCGCSVFPPFKHCSQVSCSSMSSCEELSYRLSGYQSVDIRSSNEAKISIKHYGPGVFRYDVYDDFYDFWDNGLNGQVYVQSGSSRSGGHAVAIIGYDDRKGAWLCKNSWGETGPNGDGTFWIAYAGHRNDLGFRMSNFSISGVQTCEYGIYPSGQSFGTSGGTGSISVDATTGCTWTAGDNAGWITITSSGSGTGKGTVNYSVDSNTGTNSRTGIITAAGKTFTITQSGLTCSYSILPTGKSFSASGGTGSVAVTASNGCKWNAQSNADWITVVSGSSKIGNGVVNFQVASNSSTGSRTGTMTVAGRTFTITQSGMSCFYSISPSSRSVSASGETGSVSVTAISGCEWTAASNVAWIAVTSGTNGTGNGTVDYSVSENQTINSRTGTITIAGKTFTVSQAGQSCSYTISPTGKSFDASGGTGSVNVVSLDGCSWTASTNVPWINTNSTGTGNGAVQYTVSSNPSISSRTGTIALATEIFTVSQSGKTEAPTDLQASDGSDNASIFVSWKPPIGATCYEVYRSNTSNVLNATLVSSWNSDAFFEDTSAIPGQTYFYWAKAASDCNGTNASDFSASDSGWRALGNPTNLSASDDLYTDRVEIAWNAVEGATHYRVFRNAANDSNGAAAISSWQTFLTYDDTTATAGQQYYYWVKAAVDSAGTHPSDFSAPDKGSMKELTPGQIQFGGVPPFSVLENAGNFTVEISRTGGSDGTVSVQFSTQDGQDGNAATSASDYTQTASTVTFLDGETSKTISIPINNDSIIEGDEKLNLLLTNPTGGSSLGTSSVTTLTIIDEDFPQPGEFRFDSSGYSVNENDGSVSIRILRANGNDGLVSVNLSTSNGTAAGGSDYTAVSNRIVSFPDGVTEKTETISITDDSVVESSEYFNVAIGNPTGGATIGSPSSAQVTIEDHEPGQFYFAASSYSVSEGSNSKMVTIGRMNGSDGSACFNYATSNGTAVSGSDYSSSSGQLCMSDGQTSKNLWVSIVNDSTHENSETFSVNLSGPTNGSTVGSPSSTVITISDDDPCTYSLSPSSRIHDAGGYATTFTVNAPSTCSWTATSNASWIAIMGFSGGGTGSVTYQVQANSGTTSRTGTIQVANQTYTVTQTGWTEIWTEQFNTNPFVNANWKIYNPDAGYVEAPNDLIYRNIIDSNNPDYCGTGNGYIYRDDIGNRFVQITGLPTAGYNGVKVQFATRIDAGGSVKVVGTATEHVISPDVSEYGQWVISDEYSVPPAPAGYTGTLQFHFNGSGFRRLDCIRLLAY